MSRPSAHSARFSCASPHGLPCTSIPLKAPVASCGNLLSISTRWRRMSTMRWICSIPDRASLFAPSAIRASHTACSVATSVIMSGPSYSTRRQNSSRRSACAVAAARAASSVGALSSRCSRWSITRNLGLSALPVFTVGQLIVHRPHSRHEAMSSNCFQVYCSTCETPKVSAVSKVLDRRAGVRAAPGCGRTD